MKNDDFTGYLDGEKSYYWRHGFKDDYVKPSIDAIQEIQNIIKSKPDYPVWPGWMINNILRMIVHKGLYAEYENEKEA